MDNSSNDWNKNKELISNYLKLKKHPVSTTKISRDNNLSKKAISSFLYKSNDVIRVCPQEVGSGKNKVAIWKWAPGMGKNVLKKNFFNPDKPRMNISFE